MRLCKEYLNMAEMAAAFFEGVWAGEVRVVVVAHDVTRPPTVNVSGVSGLTDKDVATLRKVLGDARAVTRAIQKQRRDEKKARLK